EVTPHYDDVNNKLFFSSEGHPGFGGLDVFSVEGFGGELAEEILNAGFPINSSADDLYLSLDEKGTKGYMVSNRVGTTSSRGETCCDDVFKVSLIRDLFLSFNFALEGDSLETPVEGVAASLYKVNNGDFDFVGEGTTGSKNLVLPVEDEFAYKMNGNKDGFWPSITTIDAAEIASLEEDTLFKTFYLKAVDRIKVKNVYFAFDKSDIRTMYGQEMDSVLSLMNKFGDLVLQIDGHTDSKGSDVYNERLSKRRATEAKAYFLEQGITTERINTAGFGETNPIAPNENSDGSDNQAGRAKNRRVEFKLSNIEKGFKVDYEAQDPKSFE
ncbi:MAG: outer membrane protein OmpA-like peptidoglycan-associated protein, partial [Planctomycetota bacterium]